MASIIGYQKTVTETVKEQFEVEDSANVFLKGIGLKEKTSLLSVTTDVEGITKVVRISAGKLEYKLKEFDSVFIYDTIKSFLEAYDVVQEITRDEFAEYVSGIVSAFIMPPLMEEKS